VAIVDRMERDLTEIDWPRYRAMAVDIDGTLAGADGRVTRRTVDLLGRAEASGLRIVLVTGRAYPSALAVWNDAGLSGPVITCGGALTLQPPALDILEIHTLGDAVAREAMRLGVDLDLTVSLWTQEAIWVNRDDSLAGLLRGLHITDRFEMEVRPLARDARAPAPYGSVPVVKAMLGAEPVRLDRVPAAWLERLAPATVARSMPEFFDVTPAGSSKHAALVAVLRRLAIAPGELIAVGDGDNDLGMLTLAGLAVVPENAMPAPRSLARVVIGHHDREGVADFIESYLRARGAVPAAR
jgi:Cof subfamily protein (haloacid dehalogenase superfamily)